MYLAAWCLLVMPTQRSRHNIVTWASGRASTLRLEQPACKVVRGALLAHQNLVQWLHLARSEGVLSCMLQGVRIVLSTKSSSGAAAASRSEEAGSPGSVLDAQLALEGGGVPCAAAPAPPGRKRKRDAAEEGALCALRARLEGECSQVGGVALLSTTLGIRKVFADKPCCPTPVSAKR